jgi:hypothetical protein
VPPRGRRSSLPLVLSSSLDSFGRLDKQAHAFRPATFRHPPGSRTLNCTLSELHRLNCTFEVPSARTELKGCNDPLALSAIYKID